MEEQYQHFIIMGNMWVVGSVLANDTLVRTIMFLTGALIMLIPLFFLKE